MREPHAQARHHDREHPGERRMGEQVSHFDEGLRVRHLASVLDDWLVQDFAPRRPALPRALPEPRFLDGSRRTDGLALLNF